MFGVVVALGAFLILGGIVFGLGFIANRFLGQMETALENMASEDPEKVRQVTREITDIEIPQSLSPVLCSDLSMFLGNGQSLRQVVWANETHSVELTLAEMPQEEWGPQGSPQAFARPLDEPASTDGESPLGIIRTVEIPVRGETVKFEIMRTPDMEDEGTALFVTGVFPGKTQRVTFSLHASENDFSLEEVEEMLGTIR